MKKASKLTKKKINKINKWNEKENWHAPLSQLICESKSPLYVDCLKARYKMRNETNLPKKKKIKKVKVNKKTTTKKNGKFPGSGSPP